MSELSAQNEQLCQNLQEQKVKTDSTAKQLVQLKEDYNMETTKLNNKVKLLDQEKMHLERELSELSKRNEEEAKKSELLFKDIQEV